MPRIVHCPLGTPPHCPISQPATCKPPTENRTGACVWNRDDGRPFGAGSGGFCCVPANRIPLCSTPNTLCSTPSTLCGTPNILCSTPSTLWSTPNTLCSTPSTLNRVDGVSLSSTGPRKPFRRPSSLDGPCLPLPLCGAAVSSPPGYRTLYTVAPCTPNRAPYVLGCGAPPKKTCTGAQWMLVCPH